jgi:two-component sensor histidine kinase
MSGGRVVTAGPHVSLDARAALSVTMVFNELLTNAAKYGALSAPDGFVSLTWKIRGGDQSQVTLECEWLERGGPPVTPPKRRGFGTRLMERCVEHDLAGEFDLIFDQLGARCTIAFPVMPPASHG